MGEEELRFIGDKLFVYTPLSQYGEGIYKTQLVITKEVFQECYKRWIEPQETGQTNKTDRNKSDRKNEAIQKGYSYEV